MLERRDFLYFTIFPVSPPTFGAQRRIEGLMRSLARRHRVSAVTLCSSDYDADVAREAMQEYCERVYIVPGRPERGMPKRLLQLRSLLSWNSFERHNLHVPEAERTLGEVLRARRYDVISLEAPFIIDYDFTQAPPGQPRPLLIMDQHNVEYDLARQSVAASETLVRKVHHLVNWRKMRREEIGMWHRADGAVFVSADDLQRAKAQHPGLRGAVVPNAVDVQHFRPDPGLPPPDGRTLVFFGTMNYFPNVDGIRWFLNHIWPILSRSHPQARVKIIGSHPAPDVLAMAGPRVEVLGLVDDLRPHLSSAAGTIVPLRVGGGTRFKILEAMAMGRPVVSTRLGAEGIDYTPGKELLIGDTPEEFAAAAGRLIDEPALGVRLGTTGRVLVEQRYSWDAAASKLENFVASLPAPA